MQNTFEKRVMNVRETIFESNAQHIVEQEVMLPEYCPEVFRIIRTFAKCYVTEKKALGKSITVEGKVKFIILYTANDDCNVYTYEQCFDFDHTFETERECDNSRIRVKITNDYVNCKAQNRRKLLLKTILAIAVKATCSEEREIICESREENMRMQKRKMKNTSVVNVCEKQFMINDEIYIDLHFPGVKSIILSKPYLNITDRKILQNKVVLKGSAVIDFLYTSKDDDEIYVYKYEAPFGQIIDIYGCDEKFDAICEGNVNDVNFELYDDESGETRIIKTDITCSISCEILNSTEDEIVRDAYSMKKEVECKYSTMPQEFICEKVDTVVPFKKNITLDIKASKICFVYGECKIEKAAMQSGELCVSGIVEVNILLKDLENKPCLLTKPCEFLFKEKMSRNFENMKFRADCRVCDVNYVFTGEEKLEIKGEIKAAGSIFSKQSQRYIENVEILDKNCEKIDHSMVLYYAHKGENIWDIAKKYKACLEKIMKYNELENDMLTKNIMLVIPVN